jgi:hypothetical protein
MALAVPLRRSIMLSLIATALVPGGPVAGAPERMNSDGLLREILGKWQIASFEIAPISAVSMEDASKFVGQPALFDLKYVEFGPLKCEGPTYSQVKSLMDNEGSVDIIVTCASKQTVPNLSYNQKARRLAAELDGATFRLRRSS